MIIRNQAIRLAFVISIRSLDNIHQSLHELEKVISHVDLIVVVNQSREKLVLEDRIVSERIVNVISTETLGLSRGRNIGIDFLVKSLNNSDGIIFPNDVSKYSEHSITLMREHLLMNPNSIAVGSWVSDKGVVLLSPFQKYENSRHLTRAYEPAIVFPLKLFSLGLRFDESIGTGSASPYQSGEGAHLLYEALHKNIQIITQSQIECVNPTTKRALSVKEYTKKSFYYGAGTGFYLREKLWPDSMFQSLVLIFGPLVGYLVGKGYWKTQGLLFTFCNFLGRIYGFIRFRERIQA